MGSMDAGNTRLRSARQALGLRSQEALANAVTKAGKAVGLHVAITARTVRRWESDAPGWPHPDHQAALEALFQRPITELGFAPPWTAAGQDSKPADTPRAGTGAFAYTGAPALSALAPFPQRPASGTISGSVASDYMSITAAYRHMYWSVPSTQLHDGVAAHFNMGVALLPAISESARRPLAAAISESALLSGRIEFFDLQDPVKAQSTFVVALQAAQDAQDPLLGAAVLAHMAFIPAFSGDSKRAEEARDKIRAARTFARRGPASPEMLAWLDAVEAEAETRFGNTRKALQLIHHAEDIFATGEPLPSPPWLDWFSEVRLAGFKGNTLLLDNQIGPARDTLERVLADLPDEDAKQRSVFLGDLAAVAVKEGDPDKACALAEQALDHLGRYWYATGMDRIRSLRQSLNKWESRPCVRRLDERLYDWSTTVSSLTG
jgi:hypothetical protein